MHAYPAALTYIPTDTQRSQVVLKTIATAQSLVCGFAPSNTRYVIIRSTCFQVQISKEQRIACIVVSKIISLLMVCVGSFPIAYSDNRRRIKSLVPAGGRLSISAPPHQVFWALCLLLRSIYCGAWSARVRHTTALRHNATPLLERPRGVQQAILKAGFLLSER